MGVQSCTVVVLHLRLPANRKKAVAEN